MLQEHIVSFYSKNPETVYHNADTRGTATVLKAAFDLACYLKQPLKICRAGTLVTVDPNIMNTPDQVFEAWESARADYQKNKNPSHPALCPECAKEFAI